MQEEDKNSRSPNVEYGQPIQIKEDISMNIKALSSRDSQSNSIEVSAISPSALGLVSSNSKSKTYGMVSRETSAK